MTRTTADAWRSQPLKPSRFLHQVRIRPGEHLLTHGIFGHPLRASEEVWEALQCFEPPRTVAAAADLAPMAGGPFIRLVETLVARQLLVPAELEEDEAVRAHFLDPDQKGWRAVPQPAWVGGALPLHSEGSWASDRVPARALVLGACFAQGVETLLVERGQAAGFALEVQVASADAWPLVERVKPDVVIYQMPGSVVLRPLLDHFAALPPHEIEDHLAAFADYAVHAFGRLAAIAGDALVLVHGYYVPLYSPLGAQEYRAPIGFFEAVRQVNQAILDACRAHDRFHFVDEDRLFGAYGKRRVQDDHLNLYSHHGALDYAERVHGRPDAGVPVVRESFGLGEVAAAERLLVDEYLTLLQIHLAPRPIKCVVVDLDGTLWPGALGDEHFDLGPWRAWLTQFRYAGLHQALKILKARGILLAIASKNNPADVAIGWRYPLGGEAPRPGSEEERTVFTRLYRELYGPEGEQVYRANEHHALMHLHLLRPEDFVTARVGWERKSEMIASIAEELGLGLDQIAFLDDAPVVRAEVRAALPDVWVVGDDPNLWREALLASPRLQPAGATPEAARRTELVRAQLVRERERVATGDPATFLATLGLRCRVRRERDDSALVRATELLARTNQMNLTTRRHPLARLQALLASADVRLYTLAVADRFTDYGMVGVAIVMGSELESFAVSCRVLGMGVEDAFLRAIVEAEPGPLDALFVPTARNLPASALLPTNGFEVAEELPEGVRRYRCMLDAVPGRASHIGLTYLGGHPLGPV